MSAEVQSTRASHNRRLRREIKWKSNQWQQDTEKRSSNTAWATVTPTGQPSYGSLMSHPNFGSGGKESAGNSEDPDSILGSGRAPGGGHGYPLHCSCLENSLDRGAWQATVHGVVEADTTEQLTRSYIYIKFCIRLYTFKSVICIK